MDMRKFEGTPYSSFIADIIQNCLRELPGGWSVVDNKLLATMCRSERKAAQVVIQMFANSLEDHLHGRPLSEAEGLAQSLRLLLGSLGLAYTEAWGADGQMPPDLVQIIGLNGARGLLIEQCMDFVKSTHLPEALA